jgi:cyanophycinase-like exopeptidase
MALCSHTLVRATWPNRFHRRPMEALGAVPRTALLPHYDTFGHRWVDSAREAAPDLTLLGVDERSAVVWRDGTWTACGPGAITVVRGKKHVRFESGAEVKGLRQPVRTLPTR